VLKQTDRSINENQDMKEVMQSVDTTKFLFP